MWKRNHGLLDWRNHEVNIMQVSELEEYRDKIKAAYEASAFTEGIYPEPEDTLKQFETR